MTTIEKHQLNADFIKAFPLESLKDMTIEQYTNLNRSDSFCYWIESKTYELGSVWGGSSYKFGIYQYKNSPKGDQSDGSFDDRYAWNSSLGKTADEAFLKVKETIIRLAECGRDGNLEEIEDIKELWPVIKWKIAFLYSNESIIPYYSLERLRVIAEHLGMQGTKNASIADIQHFLIDKREGRDVHEYAEMLHNIWNEYGGKSDDSPVKVWMWGGEADTFQKDRLVCGSSVSHQMRDYSEYKDYETMRADFQNAHGNTDVSVPDAYWKFMKDVQVGDIVVVFLNKRVGNANHHTMLGWGVFTSDLINDTESENPLQRLVEWKAILDEPITTGIVKNTLFFHKTTEAQAKEIKKLLGIIKTDIEKDNVNLETKDMNTKYQKYIDLLTENYNLVLTGAPGTGKTYMAHAIAEEMKAEVKFVQFHPSYDYTDFVEGLRPTEKDGDALRFEREDGIFKSFCREAIKNIEDSEKTVENLALELSWQERMEQFVDDASETRKKFKTVNGSEFTILGMHNQTIIVHNEVNEKTNQIAVNADEILDLLTKEVPLHIVRDIRSHYGRKFAGQPDSYAFVIINEIKKMKQNAPSAAVNKVERKPFVFIIDEINRGEASKIFGELFYAIDPGYRGKKDKMVQTQYQNLIKETDPFAKGFYVPENVYILATMNDIDRSVESMDFAMRRRFTWKEVKPEDTQDMLDDLGETLVTEAKATMKRLNAAITETDGLGAAYSIGSSYFLKLGKNGGDFNKLWEMNIEPLLREYLRGFRKMDEILSNFRQAYFDEKAKEETQSDTMDLLNED